MIYSESLSLKGHLRSIIEIKVVESIGALILEFEGQEFNSEI